MAAARDTQRDHSLIETAKVWITKRVPQLITSLGDMLMIPPG